MSLNDLSIHYHMSLYFLPALGTIKFCKYQKYFKYCPNIQHLKFLQITTLKISTIRTYHQQSVKEWRHFRIIFGYFENLLTLKWFHWQLVHLSSFKDETIKWWMLSHRFNKHLVVAWPEQGGLCKKFHVVEKKIAFDMVCSDIQRFFSMLFCSVQNKPHRCNRSPHMQICDKKLRNNWVSNLNEGVLTFPF